jgi:hypothetical protein
LLWVTDPLIERQYLAGENGDYAVGECFITVSLGEPLEGFCYKLVATVITLDYAEDSFMMDSILTIGHSTHEFDLFSELLLAYEVTAIADVRSKPYSRLCSQFNREALKAQLQKKQIAYVFLGKELGARPEDPNC